MDTIKKFLEAFEDLTEQGSERPVNEETLEQTAALCPDITTLQEGLHEIRQKADDFKKNADLCKQQLDSIRTQKEFCDRRIKLFNETLGRILLRLNVASVKSKDGIKITNSTRSVLEVDEEWLLARYENLADVLQKQLPPYVKVSLSVDKNKLSAYLKEDSTLLTDNPEKIHTKTSRSTSIKWPGQKD